MGKVGSMVKLAVVAGPAVVDVVRRMWPTISRLMRENPEVFSLVKTQVDRLATARQAGRSPEGLRRRIGILRDQVAYLRSSADDETERARADAWRGQLDRLESSIVLLDAMGSKQAKHEREHIDHRIDELSAEILAAYIDERDEDARLGR